LTEITINIRKYRKRKGLSQNNLAEKLNVTRQTVSSWENGKTYPDLDMIVRLSEVLDTDPNHLLYPEQEKKKQVFGGISLGWVLLTMVVFFLGMTFGLIVWNPLFGLLMDVTVTSSYLIPIYGGVILLAGLIVLCTILVVEEMRELKYKDIDEV
jgi:transcriptional regulator with XRE-family HTH domain